MTMWTIVALLFLTLALGIAAWLLFMWGVKSGQFDDIEGPKYRIFDDDDIPIADNQDTLKPGNSSDKEGQGHKNHNHTGK